MPQMKSLTLKGKYYEIVDEQARMNIERNCASVCTDTAEGYYNFINDSAYKPLQGLRVYGKTSQRTTTGKNLLEITTTSHTNEGVTYTINPDGSVIANGTATGTSVCSLNNGFVLKAGVAYTLTGCPAGGGASTYRIDDVNKLGDDGAGSTATYAEDTTNQIRIRIASGVTVSNLVFWPMIRLASETNDKFEPYTGGIPSPNPEYPQEIAGVSNPRVTVLGNNLLPYPYYFTSEAGYVHAVNGASFTNIGSGGIKLSGTPTGYASAILTNNFMLDSDISISLIGNSSNAILEINLYDEDRNFLDGFTGLSNLVIRKADYPGKVTMNMSVKRGVDNVAMSGTIYPMIVAGTVVATEYTPYVDSQTLELAETLHGMYNEYPETYPDSYKDENGVDYVSDYVEFGSDGSGKLIQHFCVVTLTGEETISPYRDSENTDTYFGFQMSVNNVSTYSHSFFQKCSHFKFGSASTSGYYPNTFLCHSNGLIYVRVEIEGVNSVDTFKAWLAAQYAAGTPVRFVYIRSKF